MELHVPRCDEEVPEVNERGEEERRRRRARRRRREEAVHSPTSDVDVALEGAGDLGGVLGELDRIDVARAGELDLELLANAAGMRGEKDDAIAEAGGLADVVRDEDDRLLAGLPDFLDVAVELLAGEGVERGERLVHEQDARIRREGAGERDALFHAAGELVDIRARRSARGRRA